MLHLEGDTPLGGSVVLRAPQPPFCHHLALTLHFPLSRRGRVIHTSYMQMPSVCISPLSEQKSWINENKVPV